MPVLTSHDALLGALDAGIRQWENGGGPLLAILDQHVSTVLTDVADLVVDKPLKLAVRKAIDDRLAWASLHWGTEDVHPDAWPHIVDAAIHGVVAALKERA